MVVPVQRCPAVPGFSNACVMDNAVFGSAAVGYDAPHSHIAVCLLDVCGIVPLYVKHTDAFVKEHIQHVLIVEYPLAEVISRHFFRSKSATPALKYRLR